MKTITLSPGIYRERLVYTDDTPLTIRGTGSTSADTLIALDNCESMNPAAEPLLGGEARSVVHIKAPAAAVTLENLSIENTHVKVCGIANQAEALNFNSGGGFLRAVNVRLISRQDTLQIKGCGYFKDCYIAGDVDFIWGYACTVLFDNCHIHVRADNRGTSYPAYVLQSRCVPGGKGFVFRDCTFTADPERKEGSAWIARTDGRGSAAGRWDNIALVNCRIDTAAFHSALWTDEGKSVYPAPASAAAGWREYGTTDLFGNPVDTNARHSASYLMSAAEARQFYVQGP